MNYTVVVAEDEELLLNNLVKKIERLDSDFTIVGKAQTGMQAFELVKQYHPDLIISDIRMPVMDGITLLTKVRSLYPLTQFIITSGFSDFEYTRTAIGLKVTDYLLKPIDPEELSQALSRVKKELCFSKGDNEEAFQTGSNYHSQSEIAELLKDYLIANYAEELNLNKVAENMSYSPGYLTKIFCQTYDCTPSKYLTNLRIAHAEQLLSHNPSLSVREIGEHIGYHDQAYFSRIFKKHTGKSPNEYRNEKEN